MSSGTLNFVQLNSTSWLQTIYDIVEKMDGKYYDVAGN